MTLLAGLITAIKIILVLIGVSLAVLVLLGILITIAVVIGAVRDAKYDHT